jgi:hypothetical protein
MTTENLWTGTATTLAANSAASDVKVTVESIKAALSRLTLADDKLAQEFNARWAKPHGFDFDEDAVMIVPRSFDQSTVPLKYRQKVMQGGASHDQTKVLLFKDSSQILDKREPLRLTYLTLYL